MRVTPNISFPSMVISRRPIEHRLLLGRVTLVFGFGGIIFLLGALNTGFFGDDLRPLPPLLVTAAGLVFIGIAIISLTRCPNCSYVVGVHGWKGLLTFRYPGLPKNVHFCSGCGAAIANSEYPPPPRNRVPNGNEQKLPAGFKRTSWGVRTAVGGLVAGTFLVFNLEGTSWYWLGPLVIVLCAMSIFVLIVHRVLNPKCPQCQTPLGYLYWGTPFHTWKKFVDEFHFCPHCGLALELESANGKANNLFKTDA